jgi:hypothetical protein
VNAKLAFSTTSLIRKLFISFILCAVANNLLAQNDSIVAVKLATGTVVKALVVDGDTFPIVNLETFYIVARKPLKSKRYSQKYRKLRRDVKRAYPYAKLAGMKLKEYDAELKKLKTDHQRRKFMKKVEEELKEEFEGDLRELTVRQGIILIKLIDRETGDTSYELVKQFRGAFSAFFWQSLARLFGHNLKLRYDPDGEDKMIEEIVLLIEKGEI